MRYGRITASKAYEAIRCNTYEGIFVENILGAKIFQSREILRGLKLETRVLEVLSKKPYTKFSSAGLFLCKEFPMIGASTDATSKDHTIEIKCPSKEKTATNYIDSNEFIKKKYFYQIQMQMYLAKKQKAIFVVAKPNFEVTEEIIYKEYDYEPEFVENMLDEIKDFWNKAIFNKL